MTPKQINDLKIEHNQRLLEGQKAYERVTILFDTCKDLQAQIEAAEGEDYDPIPLIFGSGFWIDESLT